MFIGSAAQRCLPLDAAIAAWGWVLVRPSFLLPTPFVMAVRRIRIQLRKPASPFFFEFPVSFMSVDLTVQPVVSSEILPSIDRQTHVVLPGNPSEPSWKSAPVASDDDDDDDDDDLDEDDAFGDEGDGSREEVDDGFNDGLDEDDDLDDFDDIDEDDFDDDFDDDFEEELNDDYEIEIDDEISDEFGLSTGKDEEEEEEVDLDDFHDFDSI